MQKALIYRGTATFLPSNTAKIAELSGALAARHSGLVGTSVVVRWATYVMW